MSKAGKRLIESAEQALAFVEGRDSKATASIIDAMNRLSKERCAKIEARAKTLIAEEMTRSDSLSG